MNGDEVDQACHSWFLAVRRKEEGTSGKEEKEERESGKEEKEEGISGKEEG